MNTKPKELIIAQINHQETELIPYRLAFQLEETKYELDKYFNNDKWRSLLDNCIQYLDWPHPGLGIDFLETENNIVIDCYGGKWNISLLPAILISPALPKPSLAKYNFPIIDKCFASGWIERSMDFISDHSDYFIVARIGLGIFERSWAMRGFENSLIDAVINPDFYVELTKEIANHQKRILEKVLQLPVDGIIFGDDWGYQEGVLLGADRWRQYIKPLVAELYNQTHHAGKYTLNHVCGSIEEIIPDLIEIGLDVLESVQPEAKGMNPYELKKRYGDKITFWGGIGSQSILQFGTPEEIRKEVNSLISTMARDGGYILSPAKPIQPGTPIENTAALVESFINQKGNQVVNLYE